MFFILYSSLDRFIWSAVGWVIIYRTNNLSNHQSIKTKSDYGAQSNKDIEIKILTKTSQMKRKSLEKFSN